MANLSRIKGLGARLEDCCTTTRKHEGRYWPAIPDGVNAVEIIPISQIIADHCGPDAASVYLIEAAASFG